MKQLKFPLTIGKEGIDPYFVKDADGIEIPWSTPEEAEQWRKEADEDTLKKGWSLNYPNH